MTTVVDASTVVAALISSSSDGDWARERLLERHLVAPQLIHVESVSVLRRAEQSNVLTAEVASLAHRDLLDLPIETYGYPPFAKRAWELRHNVSAYDAWYVALAEELDAPLVTLDRRLVTAPGIRCRFVTADDR